MFPSGIMPTWGWPWSGLRSLTRSLTMKFWGDRPRYDGTLIHYDEARSLYRNEGTEWSLGAQFCKPVIDLAVNFTGQPQAATEDADLDDFLNTCLKDYWLEPIQEMLRNAMRDSKTIVYVKFPDLDNPLMTLQERQYGRLEVVDPERVVLEYDPGNKDVIEKAFITRHVLFVEEEEDLVNGILPKETEHEILEIISQEGYRYFDRTDRRWLEDMARPNTWGIVPLVEVWNEYDSSLSGGQSDLEPLLPFIRAFHDVMCQSLQAHKYHSVPKIMFKLEEVSTFIRNNFPEAWDAETGTIKARAEISWQGREILFLQATEDASFVEARSVLNDSKELLTFLIDCIVVASETPRWAFMLIEPGSANQSNNAQTVPFMKKIDRKRKNYVEPIQKLLKIIMLANNRPVVCPAISWDVQRADELTNMAQGMQMLVMSLEVLAQRQIISDETYREIVRPFLPAMKNPGQEATDAKDNFNTLPEPTPNGSGNPRNVPVTQGQQGKNE
jgi:hypothetical protein